jgi:hypothetical protein
MELEQLKKQFLVDEEALTAKLEPILAEALKYCVCDKKGHVLILTRGLSGRNQTMMVLAARAIASQLDSKISPQVSVEEIVAFTGLPRNQVRARGKELLESRFAVSPARGVYQAVFHRVEAFLDSLSQAS